MRRSLFAVACLALTALCATGCGGTRSYRRQDFSPAAAASATYRLLLIGDAGEMHEPEPVLTTAAVVAGRMAGRTTALYLGDNAYPKGIHGSPAAQARARALLARQFDAVAPSAQVVFLPGNHDWAGYGRGGLQAIVAQSAYVRRRGALFKPTAGCPGPEALDLPGGRPVVRVVALDTQWWLQAHERGAGCDPGDRAGFVARLRSLLDTALPVVIAAHHPLATHGEHGGFIPWQTHVFPLRSIPGLKWAWLPLPGLGSIYPFTRWSKRHEQDLNGRKNTDMRAAIGEAIAGATRPPIVVYASGHDHALQVLEGPGVDVSLVSGAGASHHETAVGRGPDTLLAQQTAGFMMLDVTPSGLALAVVDPADPATWDRWFPLRRVAPRTGPTATSRSATGP